MWYSPSLQQLLFLEIVLEEGSFVRAAERLHTTHSTISRSRKALSSGLGSNLFDKTPRGLRRAGIWRPNPKEPGAGKAGLRFGSVRSEPASTALLCRAFPIYSQRTLAHL